MWKGGWGWLPEKRHSGDGFKAFFGGEAGWAAGKVELFSRVSADRADVEGSMERVAKLFQIREGLAEEKGLFGLGLAGEAEGANGGGHAFPAGLVEEFGIEAFTLPRFAAEGGLQIFAGGADAGQIDAGPGGFSQPAKNRREIAGVDGLSAGGGAEEAGDFGIVFLIGLASEGQIARLGIHLGAKSDLQIFQRGCGMRREQGRAGQKEGRRSYEDPREFLAARHRKPPRSSGEVYPLCRTACEWPSLCWGKLCGLHAAGGIGCSLSRFQDTSVANS